MNTGVGAGGFVTQTGLKNYAGPASGCPGADWDCTTATRVVQIAQEGGENRASCEGGTLTVVGTTQTCTIMQMEGTNHAACKLRLTTEPDAEQHCTITQTGDNNFALVEQVIDQSVGPTQHAVQAATVMQSGGSNGSEIHQAMKQTTRTGESQTQDVHQVATVTQTATGAGNNSSHVDQGQDQFASGNATVQRQNTGGLPAAIADCASGLGSPAAPNACTRVEQHSLDGDNLSQLTQLARQTALSSAVAVQTQGSPDGGNDGDVHQAVGGTGSNDGHAVQKKQQHSSGPSGSSQTQWDPTRCCGVSQTGGVDNHENIDQESKQSASEELANQFTTITGSSRIVGGALRALSALDGEASGCEIRHHARNNEDASNFSSSRPAPCLLVVQTICVNSALHEGEAATCRSREVHAGSPGADVALSPLRVQMSPQ